MPIREAFLVEQRSISLLVFDEGFWTFFDALTPSQRPDAYNQILSLGDDLVALLVAAKSGVALDRQRNPHLNDLAAFIGTTEMFCRLPRGGFLIGLGREVEGLSVKDVYPRLLH